jgi:hypothetical protein
MGAKMVHKVAPKTSDVAGDGTTTATIPGPGNFPGGLHLEDLGWAKRVTVDKDTTTIIDGAGTQKNTEGRIKQLRVQVKETTSDYDREKLQERLAKLAGGVAIINVGAATETEMKDKKGARRRRSGCHSRSDRGRHRPRWALRCRKHRLRCRTQGSKATSSSASLSCAPLEKSRSARLCSTVGLRGPSSSRRSRPRTMRTSASTPPPNSTKTS